MCQPSLSLFTCPKAFTGLAGRIQRNALANWKALGPQVEILLMGDDPGVAEAAQEYGCRHIPAVARNSYGTPLLNDIFRQGAEAAKASYLCYLNADILLPPTFLEAVRKTYGRWEAFLLAGRRWNVDLPEELDFSGEWGELLETIRQQRGVLFTPDAIDYFVFPKGRYADMPAFAIGRYAWDNWILRQSVAQGIPMVEATEFVPVLHQNHDYRHIVDAQDNGRVENPECHENIALLHKAFPGVWEGKRSLTAAGWRLTREGRLARNWTLERLRWQLCFARRGLLCQAKEAIRNNVDENTFDRILGFKRHIFPVCGTLSKINPADMAVFIISCNRLGYLEKLVSWLEEAGQKRIIIVDNASDWPPLLEYLEASPHRVERLDANLGQYAVWNCGRFNEILRREFYAVTDCDILPDEKCPPNAVAHFFSLLAKTPAVTKIGFSLRIDDLPDSFIGKNSVLKWESLFWRHRLWHAPLFEAPIDTTFAVYRPGIFPDQAAWWYAARTSPPYMARHLPWYEDSSAPDEESINYARSVKEGTTHWTASLYAEAFHSDEAYLAKHAETINSRRFQLKKRDAARNRLSQTMRRVLKRSSTYRRMVRIGEFIKKKSPKIFGHNDL